MITLTRMTNFAAYGATPDGIKVRVELGPDRYGRYAVLVDGLGYTEDVKAPGLGECLPMAEGIIAKMRRRGIGGTAA